MFGYGFHELVVADRRLQFGWRSSPGFFCLFSAALEHSHRHTSCDDAVMMKQGGTVTRHVAAIPPRATDRPVPSPFNVGSPADIEGGDSELFVQYFT